MLIAALLLLFPPACVEVAGDRIRAQDLAAAVPALRQADPATPIGYAPMPGIVRWLARREMLAALGGAPAVPELPSRVCVVRKSGAASLEGMLAAMRKALPPDGTVSVLRGPAGPVPEGEYVFSPTAIRPSGIPGVYNWSGRIQPAGGGRSVPISAVVKIEIRRPVLVAKRAIAAGAAIGEGDLEAEIREVGWPPPAPAEAPSAFAGWKARRRLEAGEKVDPKWLIAPLAVQAGSRVSLTVKETESSVRVDVVALTGGRPGETILVKSPFTSERIRARLTGPGEAVLARKEGARR
ncbi:MAG: flagellar basal body P-ring formation chaperone FlgA [Bryobacteraceae bacterium]|nr:flagellar basal body P-ring formation chaperone FlgA [Bryobacteraceae bacterium]